MSTRQDYIAAVEKLVQGESPLGLAERILSIGMAVKEYSRHRPRQVVVDVVGDGGFDYAIAIYLTAWSDEFSVIKSVEYPVDDTSRIPELLQADEWAIYQKPAGKVLRFKEISPLATESMRIAYTALRTCTDSASTVADFDEEAVQALAAAFFCDLLSTYFAQSGDSTIAADSVNHRSRAQEYAARAKAFRKMYFDHLGIREGQTPAASVTYDQDKNASWGADKLTHKKKWR